MTVNEAIAQVDRVRPNTVPTDIKIGWLSRVDQYVHEEIMRGREGCSQEEFKPYTIEDGNKILLVPPPYDELYIYRLESHINYEEREIKKQANSVALYNEAMSQYEKKYMREHRALPLPPVKYY